MSVRSLTIRPLTTAAAVAVAVLSVGAFSHVGTPTTISRAAAAPVAHVAMVTPLARPSNSVPGDGGPGGRGGNANCLKSDIRANLGSHKPGGSHHKPGGSHHKAGGSCAPGGNGGPGGNDYSTGTQHSCNGSGNGTGNCSGNGSNNGSGNGSNNGSGNCSNDKSDNCSDNASPTLLPRPAK